MDKKSLPFIKKVTILGMQLEQWTHKSCIANFGVDKNWATLYNIESKEQRKGHATELLVEAKKHYENQGKKFGGSVALSESMRLLYKKLNIKEYAERKTIFGEGIRQFRSDLYKQIL